MRLCRLINVRLYYTGLFCAYTDEKYVGRKKHHLSRYFEQKLQYRVLKRSAFNGERNIVAVILVETKVSLADLCRRTGKTLSQWPFNFLQKPPTHTRKGHFPTITSKLLMRPTSFGSNAKPCSRAVIYVTFKSRLYLRQKCLSMPRQCSAHLCDGQ